MSSRSHPILGRSLFRRAAIAVAVPTLGLAVSLVASATPAWAYSCPQNNLCTWQNSGETGTQWNFHVTSGQKGGFWWYVGNAANDQISSIVNKTVDKGWVDKDCPAGGQYTWVGVNASAPNLANNKWPNGTSMNDSISAWGISTGVPAHGSRTAGGC